MSFRLAVHWAVTTVTAAVAVTVVAIPVTGWAARAVAITAAVTVVCAAGWASAPTPRKDRP